MELKLFNKYSINKFNIMLYEAKIQIFNSLNEKEVLKRISNEIYKSESPKYYLSVFPKIVTKLIEEYLTNKNTFKTETDFANYLDFLIYKIRNLDAFSINFNAAYIIAKEYETTQEEMENSDFETLNKNKSFVLMNCYDEDLQMYFDINNKDEFKRILQQRRNLNYYYISKALTPFLIKLFKYRGYDKEYIEKKEAEFLFLELEFRYRLIKKQKQRFTYLYKFVQEKGIDKKLYSFDLSETYKDIVEFKFKEIITNFNTKHSIPKKQNASNKDGRQYDTYLSEKPKLERLYKEIIDDFDIIDKKPYISE